MDATVRAQIDRLLDEMRDCLAGRIGNLRLTVRGTGLILQGIASSHHAKQIAQHMTVEGISLPLLANEIQVIGASTAVSDEERGRAR